MLNKPATQFFYCPRCRGKGCSQCGNYGLFLKIQNQVFYWRPTRQDIYIRGKKISFILNNFLDVLVFLFGLAVLIWEGATAVWEKWQFSGFLGAGILALAFVFFRMCRRKEKQKRISDLKITGEEIKVVDPRSFLSSRSLVDIEPFLDHRAQLALIKAENLEPYFIFRPLLSFPEVKKVILRLGLAPLELEKRWSRGRRRIPSSLESIFAVKFKEMVLESFQAALLQGRETISSLELFLGVVRAEPKLLAFFEDQNLNWDSLYHTVEWIYFEKDFRARWKKFSSRARYKPGGVMNRAYTSRATPTLDKIGDDLTWRAKRGALPLLVNREKELKEIVVNLSQADGNVILVGKPGVGKSALVWGLANLMTAEEVPEVLQDKRLVNLDLAALTTSGNPLTLLKRVITEVIKSGNIILFIDNIANIIGLGAGTSELDAAEMLMQVLPEATVNVIGIANLEDYYCILEQQGDFLRRFQTIEIEEPDSGLTLRILESNVGLIEQEERVFFTYPALTAAVTLSQKYLYDASEPAKSLNLLKDVASSLHRRGKLRVVREENVVHLVEEQVKVPLSRVSREEGEKLLRLAEEMHKRIIDQEEGVKMVVEALQRARAGMRSEKRPVCSLLFVGPTGVGKTETAKALAEIYFGSEERMIRLDMSEYQREDAINKLIGASPGFTGSEQGGYLTEAIRKNPFSLLLLDELEKAHPDILNAFLQVIEDGRLTDSRGRTINFTNSIIIATSNAGTSEITQAVKQGIKLEAIKKQIIEEVLTQYYRLEFLNRFDGIVLFRSLEPQHVLAIAKLMLDQVAKRLEEKNIRFSYTEEAAGELAEKGFDPTFGARPLRRLIQDTVDNALARKILSGELGTRDIAILEKGGKIKVQKAEEI